MDEIKEIEKSANRFLKSFFDATYNNNKILFNNMPNIYILVEALYKTMKELEIEHTDIRTTKRADFFTKIDIMKKYYEKMNIDIDLDAVYNTGVFNIKDTNIPETATHKELYTGYNSYIRTKQIYIDEETKEKTVIQKTNKAVEVYNNNLLMDSVIWIHEISHYRNQPLEKREETNDILTELIAFTEELIYVDYLEEIGYEKEAQTFLLEEYKNLYNINYISYYVIRITLLYFLLGEVSKENYKLLYKEDEDYDKSLQIFNTEKNKNQEIIFLILHYTVGTLSIRNYIKYKEDPAFYTKIEELNKKVMTNISLEEALKIIDIYPNKETLLCISNAIEAFENKLLNRKIKYKKR